MPETNTELYFLIVPVVLLFFVLMIIGLASLINAFSKELKYLNAEIERTEGVERRRWIRQRRRLWLSLIPFIKY